MKHAIRQGVILCCLLSVLPAVMAAEARDKGLVAHWTFDEGRGSILHDRSGGGNDGRISGATWVRSGRGWALRFDGVDDRVDCGRAPAFDLVGPLTLQAWVKPTAANRGEPGIAGKFFESYALTYYGNAHFYISSGGNHVSGPTALGEWRHIAGVFDGKTLRFYVNGIETSSRASAFTTVRHGGNFMIGCIVGDPTATDRNLRQTAFFPGLIDEVRLHSRALSASEIAACYNEQAEAKGCPRLDASRFGRLQLEPFFYRREKRAVLSIHSRWLFPVDQNTRAFAELARAGAEAGLSYRALRLATLRHEDEVAFSLAGLAPGAYELRAFVCHPYRVLQAQDSVQHSAGVTAYPDGGFDTLRVEGRPTGNEPEWHPEIEHSDERTWHLRAQGRFFSLERTLDMQASRLVVRDTLRNLGKEILGVIVANRIHLGSDDGAVVTQMSNPTIFAARAGVGLGLIALDDLYQLHQRTSFADGIAEIRDEHFGLAPGKAATIEWAIYPTATDDYYDFINQVRRDEDLHGYVAGAFSFVDRREPPSAQFVARHALAYSSVGCLGKPLDNPATPLEGIEFVHYPRECAALRDTFARTKARYPGMKVMFHVAPGLYFCNDPETRFPDSRAMDSRRRQMQYGPNTFAYYGRYISRAMFDDNWRWWLFYPTPTNSFGKAMLAAMKIMVEDIGATGMWADGYFSGYVKGGFSYEGWDGHSVLIDPKTQRVIKRLVCVPYAALPVLKQCIRLIHDAGGILISNGQPGPRSCWREPYITSCETGGGDARPVGALHLGRTVTPLANPLVIKNERDCYRDMLTKLDFGALFFWYGWTKELTHPTLTEHMYPITFESIHRGTVRGRERIVTRKSGIYAWPPQAGADARIPHELHVVYLYDARGALVENPFFSTVDRTGVRTRLALKKEQSAVVVRIPIEVQTPDPVNLRVNRYDENGIDIALNGHGSIRVALRRGRYPVQPSTRHTVWIDGSRADQSAGREGLVFPCELHGSQTIRISRP